MKRIGPAGEDRSTTAMIATPETEWFPRIIWNGCRFALSYTYGDDYREAFLLQFSDMPLPPSD